MESKYCRLIFRGQDAEESVAICRKDKIAECVQYFQDCQTQELVDKRDWDKENPVEVDFEAVFTLPEWIG